MSIWVYCIYHEQNIDLIQVKILVCIGVTKELNGRRGLRTTRITWLGFFLFFFYVNNRIWQLGGRRRRRELYRFLL